MVESPFPVFHDLHHINVILGAGWQRFLFMAPTPRVLGKFSGKGSKRSAARSIVFGHWIYERL